MFDTKISFIRLISNFCNVTQMLRNDDPSKGFNFIASESHLSVKYLKNKFDGHYFAKSHTYNREHKTNSFESINSSQDIASFSFIVSFGCLCLRVLKSVSYTHLTLPTIYSV